MKQAIVIIAIITSIVLIGVAIGFQLDQPKQVEPVLSGIGGSPYNATSSNSSIAFVDTLLQEGYGTFGSYVVTGANTTWFDVLNATTTNVNLRTGQKATSTIMIASFPASLAVGTYTFDSVFTDGLYIDVQVAGVGTSTILWK